MIFKSKIKNQKSKLLIIFSLILIFNFSYLHPALAQDASPSGSLLQKLNELKEDIASKAAQIKTQVNKKVQNKAIVGSILLIGNNEITLRALNSTKSVRYDEFTEVIGSKNKKIKIDTLEVDDNIAALGDMDDKNNLIAQRLIYLENFASNSAQLIWGQIQKTSGSTIIVKTKEGGIENILTNTQTQFFLGNEEASINDAKVEKYLSARAVKSKDGSLRARFVYFIPSTGFVKPSKPEVKGSSPSAKSK